MGVGESKIEFESCLKFFNSYAPLVTYKTHIKVLYIKKSPKILLRKNPEYNRLIIIFK
jgi:hypothetical protein